MLPESATTQLLYFALTELGPASDAEDIGAVQDLAAELGALLDLVVMQPSSDIQPNDERDLQTRSIALRLWGDLQYAIGRRHWADIGLHAAVLRRLAGAGPRTRTTDAVPAYLPVEQRVDPSGHLPLIDGPTGRTNTAGDGDLGRRFLELLPAALVLGAGHLVDPETGELPAGAIPARVGWRPGPEAPAERCVGSLRPAGAAGVLMTLDPAGALLMVNTITDPAPSTTTASDPLTEGAVAAALAGAWVMDTTLTISSGGATRQRAVYTSLIDGGAESWLWQIPLSIWHPHQFYSGQRGDQPSARALRVVRAPRP